MSVTRHDVFEELAAATDATSERTTSVTSLAADLDADVATVADHLEELVACDLARRRSDGRVRITITGEELLALDTDDIVIVSPSPEGSG